MASKGICTNVQNQMTHQQFRDCLQKSQVYSFQQSGIKVCDRDVKTVTYSRVGLNPFDNKMYCISPYASLSFGHPDITYDHTATHRIISRNVSRKSSYKRKWEENEEMLDLPSLFRDNYYKMKLYYCIR